jgi:outer membrane lipoprotein carrier protein
MWSTLMAFFLAAAPPAASPLDTIVDRLERNYNTTHSMIAEFEQRYTSKVFRRTKVSRGTLRFAKPGLMAWDYREPARRQFILDGKDLWVYQVADRQVLVRRNYDGDDLKAALRFLWGDGGLRTDFRIERVKQSATRAMLKLTPKKPAGYYRHVRLVVDLKTYRVTDSVVVDPQGNENRFRFTKVRYNQPMAPDSFRFTPPKGVVVSELK